MMNNILINLQRSAMRNDKRKDETIMKKFKIRAECTENKSPLLITSIIATINHLVFYIPQSTPLTAFETAG